MPKTPGGGGKNWKKIKPKKAQNQNKGYFDEKYWREGSKKVRKKERKKKKSPKPTLLASNKNGMVALPPTPRTSPPLGFLTVPKKFEFLDKSSTNFDN